MDMNANNQDIFNDDIYINKRKRKSMFQMQFTKKSKN